MTNVLQQCTMGNPGKRDPATPRLCVPVLPISSSRLGDVLV
eukprot:CAMPEP_0204522362 /NCGR_PEP_ID=MMETSP0661-20131031/6279_1 /ASSEMBLY_ACC=CAM_ASM_000606 /TAXON_ID=109239 /ORGANISM="Alexandrium margalefi, Strain AMGDE01CS-322" /LENGTH=40 /DNA_ID= /DNA_START= /DNA_END= /DNA_ORIENTATION=